MINQVLPEPQASLLAGILWGVKTQIPKGLYQDLITTGTVHMMAISGQNISILIEVVSKVFLPLGRKIAIVLTLLTIGMFVALVGLSASVIRAAIMGSLVLISTFLGRKQWSLYSLIITASIMLIVKPDWISDVSFQLSFLASLGIILFGSHLQEKTSGIREETVREIKISLRTTLTASLFTLPVIFFQFRQISLVSPLANLAIGWIITPVMILGLILSLTGILSTVLAYLVGMILWVPLTYIVFIVTLLARIPSAAVSF